MHIAGNLDELIRETERRLALCADEPEGESPQTRLAKLRFLRDGVKELQCQWLRLVLWPPASDAIN